MKSLLESNVEGDASATGMGRKGVYRINSCIQPMKSIKDNCNLTDCAFPSGDF